jgi:hypothetical protein
MITVRLFPGEAGIRALAPAWRSLTAQLPFKRHFHHVEWYLALAHTFELHKMVELQCVAVFSDAGRLVAVFPFRFRRAQIGTIQLNAVRLASDYVDAETARDFVLAPGLAQTNFLQDFVRYMAESDRAWDVIEMLGLLEDSAAVAALKHCPDLPILYTPGGAWGRVEFISCGDDARPFDRLSKGFKQNLRTANNKLNSKQVTFQSARTEIGLIKLLPEFLKVESSGWKGEIGTSVSKIPAAATFVHQLISQFAPGGGCEIHVMRVDNEPIASLFGIVPDSTWYIFRTGYDEAYRHVSPGHLIIENLLKQRADHKSFDTLTPYNAPPWFHAWKPDRVLQVFNAYIFRPSPQGVELANRIAMMLPSPPRSGLSAT